MKKRLASEGSSVRTGELTNWAMNCDGPGVQVSRQVGNEQGTNAAATR